jgi:type I restriction enzyme S subunit
MKQGWEIKKLGEVSEIINGGTPKTKVSAYWDGDIYWITPADLGKLTKIIVNDTPRKITDLGLEKSSAKLFPENSIILSTRAPIGHLAINSVPMSTNQGCRGIVPIKNVDTWFIYYFLKKNVELLNTLGTGATFKELSTKALAGIEIPIPPLYEQQRIVSILDKVFTAIDKTKANAEQNLKNARDVFNSYLQGVFEKKGDGWEHIRMGDICQIYDGTHFSPKNGRDGDYMYITAKNIKPYYIDVSNISYVTEDDHNDIYSRCSPKKGDVLYIKDGATAGIATVNTIEEEFSMLSSVALIKCSNIILNTFLVHYMNSSVGKKNFLGYLDGAAITRLTLIKIKNVCFSIPTLEEQQSIVNKLDALRAETQKLEAIYKKKLDCLEELKKSVLQKAFAGELIEDV